MDTLLADVDVTDQLVAELAQQADAASRQEDFAIKNVIDRQALKPSVQEYLGDAQAVALFGSNQEVAHAGLEQPNKLAAMQKFASHDSSASISLSFSQEAAFFGLPGWLRSRFNRCKTLVRTALCSVATSIGDDDVKALIKAALIALIPMFGAGGVPGIVAGILVGFVALMLKKGVANVCPI